jgi:hypothetical protein|nr:MAG TPA: secretion system protein [Caudoviricetes sp.]
MYSIDFPNMLSSAKTNLIKDNKATLSNLRLMLASWKTSLFGDPYFGTNVKRLIFEQNNIILREIIIDDIYVSIQDFMPQVFVKRNDISITLKNNQVFCTINCINKLNNEVNLYTINLTEDEQ